MIRSLRPRTGATVALLATVLAACGGGAGTAAPSATTSTAPSAAAVTAAPSVAPSAASPAATNATAASPTAGASLATSGRIELPDKGFAVTLPDGWTRIDLSSGDLEAILETAGSLSPEMAALQSEQLRNLVKAGLVVFAFGPDASSGNANIMSLPSGGLSLDLLEQVNKAQVGQLANGDVSVERVTLPAGEAIHFAYDLKGSPGLTPSIEQYLLLVGDQQLVISVTSGTAEDARAIAESIETLD